MVNIHSGVQSYREIKDIEHTLKGICHYNLNGYFKLEDEVLVLKGTRFELDGWCKEEFFPVINQDLKGFLLEYKHLLTQKEIRKLEEAIKTLTIALNFDNKFPYRLAARVHEEISQLKINEHLLIPGNFLSHFLLFEVKHTEDSNNQKTFDFKVINSGSGVGHHKMCSNKVYPLVARNLSFQKINRAFWEDFFSKCDFSSRFSKKRFYTLLNRQFEGKLVPDLTCRPHKIHNIGICVTKCTSFWLSDFLSNRTLYRVIKLYRTEKLISKLEQICKNKHKLRYLRNDFTVGTQLEVPIEDILSMSYLTFGKRAVKILRDLDSRDSFFKSASRLYAVPRRAIFSNFSSIYRVACLTHQEGIFADFLKFDQSLKTRNDLQDDRKKLEEVFLQIVFKKLRSNQPLRTDLGDLAFDVALDRNDLCILRMLLENEVVSEEKKKAARTLKRQIANIS